MKDSTLNIVVNDLRNKTQKTKSKKLKEKKSVKKLISHLLLINKKEK